MKMPMSTAAGATGPYAGKTTGAGQAIPLTANGAVDINSLIKGMVSRDVWTYYYTLSIPTNTVVSSNYSLFNAVAGQIDPYNTATTLTKVQTNMPSQAQQGFSAPRDLVLDSIGFSFQSNTTLADQNNFIANSYFEMKILDKIFFEGPITLHPSGTGLMGFSTKTTEAVWQNGFVDVHNRKRFADFAKYIAPLMQFSLIIYFPTSTNQFTTQATNVGGTGITLRVDLNGLTDRPVQ
jgi:hypothetical protein